MAVVTRREPVCAALEVTGDRTRGAPRPPLRAADHVFPGDFPEQRESLKLHADGSYDYVERWGIGIPGVNWYPIAVGWDWKTGCRMYLCTDAEEDVCCHQTCTDGGERGLSEEPPDRFPCMNDGADGRYQWFIDGVAAAGAPEVWRCASERR
jgi:hypothetical protein